MDSVAVEFADLGDWGAATLVAEYDPVGPVVRINVRALDRLCGRDRAAREALIEEAIRHELYHHAEAIGVVPRHGTRTARERGAREHARKLDR